MKKAFETKPPGHHEDTELKKKKSKKRLVDIESPPSIKSIPELTKDKQVLTSEIKKQMKALEDLVEQHPVLTSEALDDKLIKQQLNKFQEAKSQAERLLAARETLAKEYKLIRFKVDVLDSHVELTPKNNQQVIKLLHFFKPSLKIESNGVTTKNIEILKECALTAVKKHRELNPYIMTETLIKNDERDLLILISCVEKMRAANELVTKRRSELDQKHDRPKSLKPAAQGIVESVTNLKELVQKLAIAEEELTLTKAFIRHTYKATPSVDTVNEFTQIWPLLSAHKKIYDEMRPILEEREKEVAKYTGSEAYLETPLESDRLSATISSAQKAKMGLLLIKGRLVESLTVISQAVERLEVQRRDAAQETYGKLKSDGEAALTKLAKMEQVYLYRERFGPAIIKAKASIKKFIDEIEPNKGSLQEISTREVTGEIALRGIMAPVLRGLLETNTRCLADRLERLKSRFQSLKKDKNTRLSGVAQFELLEGMEQALERLEIDPESYIADKKYCDDFANVMTKMKEQEHDADTLLDNINLRENSIQKRIIDQMVALINTEIATLSSVDGNDARLPILENMREGLQLNINEYMQLKTDNNTFVGRSLQTIKENCAEDNLRHLSDNAASGFINFIRVLIEPINRLLKKMTGTTYAAGFFASTTESKVAQAAQQVHTVLSALEQNLELGASANSAQGENR